MSTFSHIQDQIKEYLATKDMMRLVVLLAGSALIVFIAAFYLPLVLFLITLPVFATVAFFTVKNQLSLISLARSELSQRNQIRALIENVREGVILYDTNFKILKINRAAEELFQISASEVVGQYIDPGLVKQRHFKTFAEIMFPSLAPAVTQISEAGRWPQIVNVSLDTPKLELSTTLYQITDDSGLLIGFLKLVKDLTREKALLETKSEFLSIAAHQLRTPLTAIHWSLENLQKLTEHTTPEIADLVTQTLQISDRAIKIANDLLDVSKMEEGRFGYSFEIIDLVSFIKKILEDTAPIAEQYGVKIYFDSSSIKPIMLSLDPLRMHTALTNILDNAIRYNTKNGEVTVSVRQPDANSIEIAIRDTGIGIPKESAEKMFKKFERAENAISVEPNGSGLGLFITKNIVEGHGGHVSFESVQNRGTTFTISLPLAKPQQQKTHTYGGSQSLETN